MAKFKCFDIEWDTETEDGVPAPENLPTEIVVELDDDDMAITEDNPDGRNEIICSKLSDITGWLVAGFKVEQI